MPTTNYMGKVFIKISFMETNIYRTLYEYSKMHFYYINLSTPLSAAPKRNNAVNRCKLPQQFTDDLPQPLNTIQTYYSLGEKIHELQNRR